MRIRKRALTFEDVLLVPAKSEVLPRDVSIKTKLTKKIDLNIPFVSAAMDTVTEYEAAIAMARLGGIGIIHKNMDIETQVLQCKKVKKSESGMIIDPITVKPDQTLQDAEDIMASYKISGVPVVDDNNVLVGILTTVFVYGIVALIIKLDDIGFYLQEKRSLALQTIGSGFVKSMPYIIKVIGVVGTIAMLAVGGGIIVHETHMLHSFDETIKAYRDNDGNRYIQIKTDNDSTFNKFLNQ